MRFKQATGWRPPSQKPTFLGDTKNTKTWNSEGIRLVERYVRPPGMRHLDHFNEDDPALLLFGPVPKRDQQESFVKQAQQMGKSWLVANK